jgi:hypothetical protein
VSNSSIGEFSIGEFFEALDRQRLSRELSWQKTADEIWDQSRELNDRRDDHPISPATLSGMRARRDTSCQHALFVLRWLYRAPESFLKGGPTLESTDLPEVGPDRRLRWDLKKLYEAMNERRSVRELTWKELAVALRCTPSQLIGLRTAKFATGMRLAMRITQWLGRPAAYFVYAAEW